MDKFLSVLFAISDAYERTDKRADPLRYEQRAAKRQMIFSAVCFGLWWLLLFFSKHSLGLAIASPLLERAAREAAPFLFIGFFVALVLIVGLFCYGAWRAARAGRGL